MSLPKIHREVPSWDGRRTAAIGCGAFEAVESGAAFLRETCDRLREEGYEAVVGPMDGSTWGAYRLPVWTDGSPGFFMEPAAGPHDLGAYETAGFEVAELHVSSTAAPGSRGYADLVQGLGVDSWNGEEPEKLLASAHRLVMEGFARTPFFTPVPEDMFVARYAPLLAHADPRLILRAVDEAGAVRGLTLSFPDPLRKGAVVLKTYVGSLPGAGRVMADRVHELAGELGFTEVIHALMREGIASEAQSRKFGGTVFRRYALMGRVL
ncbi:hypothetical protein [Roseibium sediminicola]|uniref:Uncharacterized protein n=1 Tax=Roseibium sediminicola TaxID=2933272 RepID=A0ABT0GPK4_9HYPH|nr:hypothetical protein [Roseibium sp. CAU 1639]MCK7611175.1 hypothetical protein [Roseibium sp. CAU 1639]